MEGSIFAIDFIGILADDGYDPYGGDPTEPPAAGSASPEHDPEFPF